MYSVSVNVTDNKAGHSPVSGSTSIQVISSAGCVQLTSPANGAVLDNGCENLSNLLIWDFAWSGTACAGATQYNIYVYHPQALEPAIDAVVPTTSYHKEDYLYAPEIYRLGWRWRVRAMISGLWTDWSLERAFDVEPVNTDCNSPPIVSSLTANPAEVWTGGTSTVTLVASDPEGDPLTCTWSASGGSLSSLTGCGSVTWTAPGTPGMYSVSVNVTDNKAGHSPVSRSVNIGVETIPVPGAPTSLSATDGVYTNRVNLTWSSPTTGGPPTGFRIYRHTSNDQGAASQIGTSTTTSYDDYVADINTYWYWVRAYNDTGNGAYSNGDSGYLQVMTLSVNIEALPFPYNGWGTVTGPGINCDEITKLDCSEQYKSGTQVTLTPSTDLITEWLQSWDGCDSIDTYMNCTVIMNSSRSVTAWFERFQPP